MQHQQPSRSTAGPPSAGPPKSNPSRTYSEQYGDDNRGSSRDAYGSSSSEGPGSNLAVAEPKRDQRKNINQVLQNLFKRAAVVIVSSRVTVPPKLSPETGTPTTTTWFHLKMNESDVVNAKVQDWRYLDYNVHKPRPLIIEIYLDIGELNQYQALAITDEKGRKWDVGEALKDPKEPSSTKKGQVVLERWTIFTDQHDSVSEQAATEIVSNVYKKGSVTMHALAVYANLLPAFRFARRTMQEPANLMALRPQFRVVRGQSLQATRDPLTTPLYLGGSRTCKEHRFHPLQTPVGLFRMEVVYRRNCNFHVSSHDELASARFLSQDTEPRDRRTESRRTTEEVAHRPAAMDVGSLPTSRRFVTDTNELGQAYGSLSTFHRVGHGLGTSPISALRAAREMDQEWLPAGSVSQRPPPNRRTSPSLKSSLKSIEGGSGNPRRQSVSFQPSNLFKAGSLSSSPATAGMLNRSPSSSYNRTSSDLAKGLAQARNIKASPQQGPAPEFALASPNSVSPKAPPLTRYESSFSHRRTRLSSGGTSASREEDKAASSGSASSSKRGSITITAGAEAGSAGAVSTSVGADNDGIGDFLKMLESKKDLKIFHRMDDATRDARTRQTVSALSKYRGMRESNAQLSESMSASSLLNRSRELSSPRLSGVPPMVVSTSSSPSGSKPLSPYTPHTPAIPSRLATEATVRSPSRHSSPHRRRASNASDVSSSDETIPASAIPIPQSPQGHQPIRPRRASSARNTRHRASLADLLSGHTDHRPASLPLNQRATRPEPDLHHDDMFDIGEPSRPQTRGRGDSASTSHTEQRGDDTRLQSPRKVAAASPSEIPDNDQQAPASISHPSSHRAPATPARLGRLPQAENSSSTISNNSVRGSIISSRRGSTTRFSFANRPGAGAGAGESGLAADDEEPLLFTMSELDRRGGSSAEDVSTARVREDQRRRVEEQEKDKGPLGEDQGWSG